MPEINEEKSKKNRQMVTLSDTTSFNGVLKFKEPLCIRGKFIGTISAETADLVVDKGADVRADSITVTNLGVYGKVSAPVRAANKIDLYTGAELHGDLVAGRLRIADGVVFEGKCSMIEEGKEEIEIFSRPTAEIKAELMRVQV
jgi:cytoskeletal protein CcmA (bactofilin family)